MSKVHSASVSIDIPQASEREREKILAEIQAELSLRLRASEEEAEIRAQPVPDAQPIGSATALFIFGTVSAIKLAQAVASEVASRHGKAVSLRGERS